MDRSSNISSRLPSSAEEGRAGAAKREPDRAKRQMKAPARVVLVNKNTMRRQIPNLRVNETKRRELRSGLTPAEAKLWKCLQRSQLSDKKFRRQHSVGPYILDFYCPECCLAIELDGAGHFTENGSE